MVHFRNFECKSEQSSPTPSSTTSWENKVDCASPTSSMTAMAGIFSNIAAKKKSPYKPKFCLCEKEKQLMCQFLIENPIIRAPKN